MATVGKILAALIAGAVFPAMFFEILLGGLAELRGSGYLPLILLVTSIHAVAFGLPSFLLLLKFGRVRAWTMVIVGFCCGIFPRLFLSLANELRFDPVHIPGYAVTGVLGALGGIAFWSVWDFFSAE